ncbi:hypothetical protein RRG08_063743 [Elysia crispata]|uniref:Uncharacterized protein n=1 Tax=Elysia crispata TaxID=231223 RepID=A0AAE0Y9D9_9GAST|nr:hypothetical protein RRG08_063743 [Elysia crispata]
MPGVDPSQSTVNGFQDVATWLSKPPLIYPGGARNLCSGCAISGDLSIILSTAWKFFGQIHTPMYLLDRSSNSPAPVRDGFQNKSPLLFVISFAEEFHSKDLCLPARFWPRVGSSRLFLYRLVVNLPDPAPQVKLESRRVCGRRG